MPPWVLAAEVQEPGADKLLFSRSQVGRAHDRQRGSWKMQVGLKSPRQGQIKGSQTRMLSPYVLNETTYGLIKAVLRMETNGIEEGGIKKEKNHICRRIVIRRARNRSSDPPRIAKYLTHETKCTQIPKSL